MKSTCENNTVLNLSASTALPVFAVQLLKVPQLFCSSFFEEKIRGNKTSVICICMLTLLCHKQVPHCCLDRRVKNITNALKAMGHVKTFWNVISMVGIKETIHARMLLDYFMFLK